MVMPEEPEAGDEPAADQEVLHHGAARVRRLGAAARHRATSSGRSTASTSSTRSCPSSRRRAPTGSRTSTTRARRSSSSRSPTCCTRSTRRIVDAGFLLQVDDAVLLHEYDSILSLGGSVEDYRRWAELRVEALNHALTGLPEDRVRYHVCFGSWHGPHVFDPPLAEVIDLVLEGERRLLPDRDGEPAPRARVAAVGGRQAARGEGARPRRRHAPHERRRASRSSSPTGSCGSPTSSAATASWAAPTAASPRARSSSACTRRSSGRSSQALAEGARIATKQLYGVEVVASGDATGSVRVAATRREAMALAVRECRREDCCAWHGAADRHGDGSGPRAAGLLVGVVVRRLPPAPDPERGEGAVLRADVGLRARPAQLLPDRRRAEHDAAHVAGDRGLRPRVPARLGDPAWTARRRPGGSLRRSRGSAT